MSQRVDKIETSAVLMDRASAFASKAAVIELNYLIAKVEGEFSGLAADALIAQFKKLQRELNDVGTNLSSMHSVLKSYANTVREEERRARIAAQKAAEAARQAEEAARIQAEEAKAAAQRAQELEAEARRLQGGMSGGGGF